MSQEQIIESVAPVVEKKKRVYKPKAKKEKEIVEEQKMKIEEEVIQPQPQPESQEEMEQPQHQNNDFLHVEEVQPEEVKVEEVEPEEQAGEEMVKIYRVNVEGKKARFIDERRFMGLLKELIADETPFEVEFEEISKSHHIYHSLQLQEKAKVEVKKEAGEKRKTSAPREKRELNNGLQVRHKYMGDTWEAVIQEKQIVFEEDRVFKTFSEFAVKHKKYMGVDTSANGVAECEWFNIDTQKWVKGMYQ